jgi:uncharacterized protein YndB with AHSA1/START domain
MSHELKLERVYDAPPEMVFDAFVDPSMQERLHGAGRENWTVARAETDVRVGGTSTYAMGPTGQEPQVETRVFSVVDRPHRLVFHHSMKLPEWGRTIETEMTVTFEEHDGTTLVTMQQTGFDRVEDRDTFLSGWPGYLDSLREVVDSRRELKARHDTP